MTKICFPHYRKGDFDSLDEAMRYFKKKDYEWADWLLSEIVQYNSCYRDHLRNFGIDSLITRLAEEAPAISQESFHRLRQWWNQKEKHIADYDIQCHHINDTFTVLEHTFKGLKEVCTHCEIEGRKSYFGFECFTPKDFEACEDIHVGLIYDNYPVFDSFDECDNRTYQNYIFRKEPITKTDLEETFKIPHYDNFRMVHEEIPDEQLPILYYPGDRDHMLLATRKM